ARQRHPRARVAGGDGSRLPGSRSPDADRAAGRGRRDRALQARGRGSRVPPRHDRLRGLPPRELLGSRWEHAAAPPTVRPLRRRDGAVIVERTDYVSVPVTDLERSVRWYADALGLEQIGFGQWPEFQMGENVSLYLMDPTNVGQEFAGPHTSPVALR